MSELTYNGECRNGYHQLARSGTFHDGDALCRCGLLTSKGNGRVTDGKIVWKPLGTFPTWPTQETDPG
jgi:hypothetical protein